jgi:hypothetical protein
MKKSCAFGIMIVAFAYLPVSATIINIPDDYPTIQQGIDASADSDTVLVADGQYYERISFNGKAIFLTSEFMFDGDTLHIQNTIIDADTSEIGVADTGSVVCFVNGEDSTSIIHGFTIQNGIGTSVSIYHRSGGGIYCTNNSGPRIADNIIRENSAGAGAGICCTANSNAIISGNFITGNEENGIFSSESDPVIMDNIISLNRSGYGSGILCISNSNAIISRNIIRENYGGLCGGGIFCGESSPLIEYNIIYANSVIDWGGGICCDEADPMIISNTISGNTALSNGGGVFCLNNASPTLTNTIIWANSPREVGLRSGGSPIIRYCDIRGGWDGEGNIDVDPLFLSAYQGDYNVCAQSPCIDAGDPSFSDPDGTCSDIGVYFPDHAECGIGKILYISTSGDDLYGDGTLENPFRTIQHGIDVSFSSDTVLVANGVYEENISIVAKSVCLASSYLFSGDPLDIQNTIIDGGFDSTVVMFASCDSATAITGFSVRNGYGWFGGGILSEYSDLTISDNIIYGNISDAVGGGICCKYGNPVILNNDIIENTAGRGGGIESHYSTAITVSYNLISGNSAARGGGIYASNLGSGSLICNNVLNGNTASSYGGGIGFFGVSCPVINNTFSENFAADGGGLYCNHSDVTVINTIFWADSASSADPEIYIDDNSSASIIYCDIQGGWEGEGNIDADPLFRDPENGDFHLMSIECGDPYDSPCIDAGHPDILDSLLDCSWGLGGLRSDIGAYGGGDSVTLSIDNEVPEVPNRFALGQNYPNPFNASTVIRYSLPEPCYITIEIFDILGRKVETLIEDEQPAGYHQIIWNSEDRSSGIYFYTIRARDHSETRKMILIK